jgi:hypothetical protein
MKTTLLLSMLLSSAGMMMAQTLTIPAVGYSGRLEPADPSMEVVKLTSVVQDTVFYNLYGGLNQDEAKDFVETYDKGFLICGSSSSYGQGTSSIYIVKTDSMGRFKWGKTFGGINSDRGMSIRNTPDHGAFISGYSNSFNNLDYDSYCVRVDSAGNSLWQRTIDGGDWDFVYGSEIVADSGLVMVGETYSNTAGDADAWMIRMNKNGDTLWTRKFGTPYHERFNSVTILNNGIYATGMVQDPTTLASRILVAHYTLSGTLVNTRIFTGAPTRDYHMNSISTTVNSHLLLGGGIVDNSAPAGAQQADIRMRIDTNLATIWIDSSGTLVETKTCNHLYEDHRGHVMASMTVTGGNGKTAMFLADFDASSIYYYGQTYGGLEEEAGLKGMITSRNKLAFLGNTYSWVGSWNNGDEDYWLVLFKGDTLIDDHKIKFRSNNDTIALSPFSLEELSANGAVLFPNPVTKHDVLILKQANPAAFSTMEILDIQGRHRANLSIEGEETIRIRPDQFGMEAGMYFVRLTGGAATHTVKIAVQD